MTWVRRVSLRVERREVSLLITRTGTTPSESRSTQMPTDTARPENCPDCGAPWITVTAYTGESAMANVASIHRALQQCGAHVRISATGELRICSKSFEEIKESL